MRYHFIRALLVDNSVGSIPSQPPGGANTVSSHFLPFPTQGGLKTSLVSFQLRVTMSVLSLCSFTSNCRGLRLRCTDRLWSHWRSHPLLPPWPALGHGRWATRGLCAPPWKWRPPVPASSGSKLSFFLHSCTSRVIYNLHFLLPPYVLIFANFCYFFFIFRVSFKCKKETPNFSYSLRPKPTITNTVLLLLSHCDGRIYCFHMSLPLFYLKSGFHICLDLLLCSRSRSEFSVLCLPV